MTSSTDDLSIEIKLLLSAIYEKYGYDFRDYSLASVKRRLVLALSKFNVKTISALQEKTLHDPSFLYLLLQYLTVPTSEMFRDANYFLALRTKIIPILKTYPSIKIWIAGCSTGEEVYSYAIVLAEEGLLDRTIIYATDINPVSLKKAEMGVFSSDRMKEYTVSYQKSGGKQAFSDYYTSHYDAAMFHKYLTKNFVFADHSLATDQVFSEVQFVSCRNVLIYFDKKLQNRALGLFYDSLSHKGLLSLGSKESLRFSHYVDAFSEFSREERIYQRK